MAKAIYNPALAGVDELSETSATFLIEPMHKGYGNTLGNSLRRVLLSRTVQIGRASCRERV